MKNIKNLTCVILISADAEWEAAVKRFRSGELKRTPYGGCFEACEKNWRLVFCQGGWGKVSAAASTQYAVTTWKPDLILNPGTCGGFAGRINLGEIILAVKTCIYDIVERMGDMQAAFDFYTVENELSWLAKPFPQPVREEILVSADQDLDPSMVPLLAKKFNASAADWESGAISWVAARNNIPCLILRAVSDLVYEQNGEAYGDPGLFAERAQGVMESLLDALPGWLECVKLDQ